MRRHTAVEFALGCLVVVLAGGLRVYYVGSYADEGRGPEPLRVQEAAGDDFTSLVRALNGTGLAEGRHAPITPSTLALAKLPRRDDPAVLLQ